MPVEWQVASGPPDEWRVASGEWQGGKWPPRGSGFNRDGGQSEYGPGTVVSHRGTVVASGRR